MRLSSPQRARIVPSGDDRPDAAVAAGLRYVHDGQPGFHRRRTGRGAQQGKGKRAVPLFAIEDSRGRTVRARATMDRIAKLAIPPAWERVWICAHERGHLQATGRDARGRKQYRYHPRWREQRDGTKFSRMLAFGRFLPALRRRVAADLRATGLPRRKVLATVARLLETTFIRVGNQGYARANNSFGLTTLKDRHVDFHQAEVRFRFRGKSGIHHEVSLRDPAIARIVRRCRDLPGQELFQYLDGEGRPATIDSADVNRYLREVCSPRQARAGGFTAKDFRTWAGSVMAAEALRDIAAHATDRRRTHTATKPRRQKEHCPPRASNADVVRAVRQVAVRLGNTPAVCRKCYVHPEVIGAFLDGTLAAHFARADAGGGPRATGLSASERALMALLRGRLAERRAGTTLRNQLRRSIRSIRSMQSMRSTPASHGGRPAPPRAGQRREESREPMPKAA